MKLGDRLLEISRADHTIRFVVASDLESGTIVSRAEWHYYETSEEGAVMDLGFVEGSLCEKEYAACIIGTF